MESEPSGHLAPLLRMARNGRISTPTDDSLCRVTIKGPRVDLASMVAAVGRLLVDGYPTIERTAHSLGLSPRTLQRRLSEAGISYREVVQTCRFEQACLLLADSTLGVSDIASKLSYADPSSFSRFFLRRSGTSPRAYRARACTASRGDRQGGARGE